MPILTYGCAVQHGRKLPFRLSTGLSNGGSTQLQLGWCRPTQSVPALVGSAHCNRAQVASIASLNWRARTFATSRRKELPVAIPLTPPSRFWRDVMVANIKLRHTTGGTWPFAKFSAASNNKERVSWSSTQGKLATPRSCTLLGQVPHQKENCEDHRGRSCGPC